MLLPLKSENLGILIQTENHVRKRLPFGLDFREIGCP